MKKIYNKFIATGFIVLFLFAGCTKDFVEMNTDPNSPSEIPPQYLLTSAQKNMMAFMWDEWWNGRFGCLYAQYFSQTSYTDESRYKYRDGVNNNYWIYFYAGRDATPDGTLNGGGMEDLERIIELNTNEETKSSAAISGSNENQIAVAKILKAWMFHVITDTWGAVPFTQALLGAEYSSPAYDQQPDVYAGLLTMLDDAIGMIDESAAGVTGDQIYGGDMAKWKMFANSIKLRIAIRMSGVNEAKAKEVITQAYPGAFTSNADNAQFPFMDGVPNNNPLNENQKTRQDFAIANTLLNLMNNLEDPRRPFYANKPVNAPEGPFIGFPYGMSQDEATPLSVNDFSMPGDVVYAPACPGFYMNYAEVCFIMAEAVHSLGVGEGTAQEWYEKGIKASMEMWSNISSEVAMDYYRIDNEGDRVFPAPITEAQMDEYLAMEGVAWDEGNALELIGTQKYIALFPQGLQAWFEYNRTSYPISLFKPGETNTTYNYTFIPLVDIDVIPTRMEYPSEEFTLNAANVEAAVAQQGPDDLDTHLWWTGNFNK